MTDIEHDFHGEEEQGVPIQHDPVGIMPSPTVTGSVTNPQSLMERLRERRDEQANRRETNMDVPGYGGELVVRYEWLSQDRRRLIQEAVWRQSRNNEQRQINLTLDTLTAACIGFFVRQADELIPLEQIIAQIKNDPEEADAAVMYDKRLAEFLGIGEATQGRQVVLGVFGGNDIAVAQHAIAFTRWLADTTREATDDFLGLISGE